MKLAFSDAADLVCRSDFKLLDSLQQRGLMCSLSIKSTGCRSSSAKVRLQGNTEAASKEWQLAAVRWTVKAFFLFPSTFSILRQTA